mgnify:CR=1 FL=1
MVILRSSSLSLTALEWEGSSSSPAVAPRRLVWFRYGLDRARLALVILRRGPAGAGFTESWKRGASGPGEVRVGELG